MVVQLRRPKQGKELTGLPAVASEIESPDIRQFRIRKITERNGNLIVNAVFRTVDLYGALPLSVPCGIASGAAVSLGIRGIHRKLVILFPAERGVKEHFDAFRLINRPHVARKFFRLHLRGIRNDTAERHVKILFVACKPCHGAVFRCFAPFVQKGIHPARLRKIGKVSVNHRSFFRRGDPDIRHNFRRFFRRTAELILIKSACFVRSRFFSEFHLNIIRPDHTGFTERNSELDHIALRIHQSVFITFPLIRYFDLPGMSLVVKLPEIQSRVQIRTVRLEPDASRHRFSDGTSGVPHQKPGFQNGIVPCQTERIVPGMFFLRVNYGSFQVFAVRRLPCQPALCRQIDIRRHIVDQMLKGTVDHQIRRVRTCGNGMNSHIVDRQPGAIGVNFDRIGRYHAAVLKSDQRLVIDHENIFARISGPLTDHSHFAVVPEIITGNEYRR